MNRKEKLLEDVLSVLFRVWSGCTLDLGGGGQLDPDGDDWNVKL